MQTDNKHSISDLQSRRELNDLVHLQNAFHDISLGGTPEPLIDVIHSKGFTPEERLSIYTNNTLHSLRDALSLTFPIITQLVGDTFFSAVAHQYIKASPPSSPCLFEYGESFSGYLAAHPHAKKLPYLADVARLEWLWNVSYHAHDKEALTPNALTQVNPSQYANLIFTPHPALQLLSSNYPIKDIWAIHQCGSSSEDTVDLDKGGQNIAILRPEACVNMLELSAPAFLLTKLLCEGNELETACQKVMNQEETFDPIGTLVLLIQSGAFQALTSR